MAERYELIIDFSKCPLGTKVVLRNGDLPNTVDFDNTGQGDAVRRRVTPPTTPVTDVIPASLPSERGRAAQGEPWPLRRRTLEFVRTGSEWTVNGQIWEDVIASGFREVAADPNLGDIEVWEFVNNSGGWFHPIHVHLVDFKILSRNGRPPPYEQGPKDVAYVGEGETGEGGSCRFGPHEGRYMIHCHNLVPRATT